MTSKGLGMAVHEHALLASPRLKGKTYPVGVRITPRLRSDAMAKARLNGDAFKTANTFAGLVRELLFQYIGN